MSPSTPTIDHSVQAWDAAKPSLREDLSFHFQLDGGKPIYVVEDLTNRGYLQVGVPEYRFLRSLDGHRSAASLIAEASSRGKDEYGLSEQDVESLLRWAIDHQLLESRNAGLSSRRLALSEREQAKSKRWQPKNLFSWKVSFGSPDRILHPLTHVLGWTFSLPALLLGFAWISWGLYVAASHWTPLCEQGQQLFLPANWIWLGLISIFLKLIHEIWHGIATERNGGVVPEWGVQMMAFITPLSYVDATSSWTLPSKWQRIQVAAAGMYIELLIASTAMHFWVEAGPGFWRGFLFNTAFTASAVTLLFNANPLLRFDGYYILSDLLEIRNLASRGQQLLAWFNRRLWLGLKNTPLPPGTRNHFFLLLLYGSLAGVWRILLTIAILSLMASLFHGAGIALVVLSLAVGLGMAVSKFAVFVRQPQQRGRINWWVAVQRIGLTAAMVAAALCWIQISPVAPALAVVEYSGKSVVRAETSGFVTRVDCRNLGQVEKGALLVELTSPEEKSRFQQLELDVQRSRQKSTEFLERDLISAWQGEQEVLKALEEALHHQRQRVEALRVRAPRSGRIDGLDLASLPGQYVTTGQPLLTILPDEAPHVLLSVRQSDYPLILGELQKGDIRFRIRIRGRPQECVCDQLRPESKASHAIPHPALSSVNGGPLVVRSLQAGGAGSEGGFGP